MGDKFLKPIFLSVLKKEYIKIIDVNLKACFNFPPVP